MKRILIYLLLINFISCEKDNIGDNSKTHVYTNEVILGNHLPLMGGCTNSNGDLITFSPPLLGENQCDILLKAKINQISSSGEIETLYEFDNENFYWGQVSYDTIQGIIGWVPRDIRIDFAIKDEVLFMTYNDDNKIYRLSESGLSEIEAMQGIISITSDNEGKVFFITSPVYGSSQNNSPLQTPPIIYEIDNSNNIHEYYRFPTDLTYIYWGAGGDGVTMYPSDILINLSCDNVNNLFVCFGYNSIIYKLDENKILSTFSSDIYCPTSICFDNQNIPFVVSAPKFNLYDSNNDYDLYVVQSVEVSKIVNSTVEKIYTGHNVKTRGGYAPDLSGIYHNIDNANYNISINNDNEIYLEDPKDFRVVLIK